MSKLAAGLLSLAAVLVLVIGVSAEDGKKGKGKGKGKRGFGNPEQLFKKLDTNKDDKLTRVEFLALANRAKDPDKAEKFKAYLNKTFDKLADGKESVTLDQFQKIKELAKKKKKKNADLE